MTGLEALAQDYRAAFFRYLPRREEAALRTAYELGRSAVENGTSLLELARLHHEVLLEVLVDSRADELAQLATAASEFLLEVLSTYDMTQRGFLERPARKDRAGGPKATERWCDPSGLERGTEGSGT